MNLRGSFTQINGDFASSTMEPTMDTLTGEVVDAKIDYTFNTSLTALGLEVLGSWNIFSGLKFNAGINFSFLISAKFTQKESLANKGTNIDGWVVEINGTKYSTPEWNVKNDADIPGASYLLSVPLGLSYEIPITPKLVVTPEIFYNIGIGNVTDSTVKYNKDIPEAGSWSLNSLRFGLSVGYYGNTPCPPGMYRNAEGNCEWEPCPPGMARNAEGICACKPGMFVNQQGLCEWPPCPERNYKRNDDGECIKVLFADIKAEPILPNGMPSNSDNVKMIESESMIAQSLLNYVFFDENSADIPKKYHQFTDDNSIGSFRENQIVDPENPVSTYYNILDIIGFRMSNSPFAKITLQSYNMPGAESQNKTLVQKRLDAVANYLKKIWKVPDFRIETQVYNLPPDLTTTNPDILNEYRRVEIIPDTSNLTILSPTVVNKKVYKAFPPKINFNLDVIPLTQIESWKMKTYQRDKVYFESSGTGKPPAIITWYPNTKSNKYSDSKENIYYSIEVTDNNKEELISEKPLPSTWIPFNPDAIPNENDSSYATYYLLFNFNDKEVDRDIRKNSSVINSIEFNEYKSKFSLTGFTDKIGDARNNKILSNQRVEAVSKYLTDNKKVNSAYISKQGLGYVELFDNSTPEGRLYNRSVIIEVSTPTEKTTKEQIKLEGCYVIVFTDENKQNSESVLNILKQRGIPDVYIEDFYEQAVDKTYFRVRTPMYKEMRDAVLMRSKISVAVRQMNLEKPPLLKCEK